MIIERNTKIYWKRDWNILCSNLINGDNLFYISANNPTFLNYCNWSKLSGYDWCLLLPKYPQFIEYCNWDKLSGWELKILLICRPQYAEFCNLNKLLDRHWSELLQHQPQLEEYRK